MSLTSQAGLYDVADVILDKGLVIDAFQRVSVISLELLTVDARVVVSGVDTYLRIAEVANRLDLEAGSGSGPLGNLLVGAVPAVGAGRIREVAPPKEMSPCSR